MTHSDRFASLTITEFVRLVSEDVPVPAGGSVAAIGTGLAAGLIEKVARLTLERWDDAASVRAQAQELRSRAILLAEQDAVAYQNYVETRRRLQDRSAEERRTELRRALEATAEPPLAIGETAAQVVELAARATECGNPELVADVLVALLIAEASTKAAAQLVHANLRDSGEADRATRATELAQVATKTARGPLSRLEHRDR